MNSRFSTRYESTHPTVARPEGDDPSDSATIPMVYKSRHISLHSRVDSLAPDGGEAAWADGRDLFTDVPLDYGISASLSEMACRRTSYESEKHDNDDNEFSPSSRLPSIDASPTSLDSLPLKIPFYHEVLFLIVVVMAQFMGFAGLGQAVAPMQYIAQDLDVTEKSGQAWFAAAYSLTYGTFMLISGRMGDILGHKRILVSGYFFLGSWSAFAGFSAYIGSQIFFDVCRAFQGVGAALLAPNALALLGRAYGPGSRKTVVFALYGFMTPCGLVLGALFASMFAQIAWWPWAFWGYAIVAWLLSACAVMAIPRPLSHHAQFASTIDRPRWDLLGALLGMTGLVMFGVAWNNGPLFAWSTPHVYLALILGMAFLAAFFWVESRSKSPVLAINFKAMGSTIVVLVLGWGSLSIWLFYSFRFLEELRGSSPVSASAQLTPLVVASVLAAVATSFMLHNAPAQFTLFVSMVAFFLGELISATQPSQQTYWAQTFISVIIISFGMAMSVPAATFVLYNTLPPENQGVAASLVYATIHYSMAIALGIAGTIEVQVSNHNTNKEDTTWGIRCAFWAGVLCAGTGVVVSCILFGRSILKQGWRSLEH